MERRSKRQRRDLDIRELIDQGQRILRDEGYEALSMRRIAKECSVTPMALYHYVSGKDELLELILDDVLSGLLPNEGTGTPDEQLIEFSFAMYRLMMSNPGIGQLWATRGITVPNMGLVTERFFRLLQNAGITSEEISSALDAIVVFIAGGVAYNLSRPPGIRHRLLDDVDDEAAPLLHELMDTYADRNPDAQFRWGLERLWEGIKPPIGSNDMERAE